MLCIVPSCTVLTFNTVTAKELVSMKCNRFGTIIHFISGGLNSNNLREIMIHEPPSITCFNTFLFCMLTNKCTKLSHKLSHCYMFRHYHVILREPVINTLPSYTSISNAAVGNTIYNYDVSHRFYTSSHIIVVDISI